MTSDDFRTLNALIGGRRSPFPAAFTAQTYSDLDAPSKWAVALDDYGNGTDGSSPTPDPSEGDDTSASAATIQSDSPQVQLDTSTSNLVSPSALSSALPDITPTPQTYTGQPGDSNSTIQGASGPGASGTFARPSGQASPDVQGGQSHVVAGADGTPTKPDFRPGQSFLDRSNQSRQASPAISRSAIQRPNAPPSRSNPAVAATASAFPTEPPLPVGVLGLPQSQGKRAQPAGQNVGTAPGHPSWWDSAQRKFWHWASADTSDNAWDTIKGLGEEIWNDLPGLVPAEGALAPILTDLRGGTSLPTGLYRPLTQRLSGSGLQANHLNQVAAYGSKIPRQNGLAIAMKGDALRDIGSPHYEFHAELEQFWNQFRDSLAGGGRMPTNAEYGAAMEKALMRSGYSRAQAATLGRQAARERAAHGLDPSDLVPRIPAPLRQAGAR